MTVYVLVSKQLLYNWNIKLCECIDFALKEP